MNHIPEINPREHALDLCLSKQDGVNRSRYIIDPRFKNTRDNASLEGQIGAVRLPLSVQPPTGPFATDCGYGHVNVQGLVL
jgi:hypothetical protein